MQKYKKHGHRKNFIATLFLVFSEAVYSGGSFFPVKIHEFSSNWDSFTFRATIEDEFDYDKSATCDFIKVSGFYDSNKWGSYTMLINLEIHLESLAILRQASKNEASINLGYIGSGFYKIEKCSYQSKGLFHHEKSIFSIFNGI